LIHKTEGIVLRTLRHQENHLITTLYTEQYGIRSFIVKGYRSSRGRRRHSYFQPLSIIDIVYMERPNRDLQQLNESQLAHLLQEVQTHPVKLSLGLALVEIFFDTVKEEHPNPAQYAFLRDIILKLDAAPKRLIQLFLYFLVHHTRFLGFFPQDQSDDRAKVTFDYRQGILRPTGREGDPVALLLRRFLYAEPSLLPEPASCQQITFDNASKRHLIRTLFLYYQEHIQGFRYPQSMRIFAEVFGGEG